MVRIILACILYLGCFPVSAQIDAKKVLKIPVDSEIENPVLLVFHSMGDINVKGHQGNQIFAYAEELLPSVSELKRTSDSKIFDLFQDFQSNPNITIEKNPRFTVQQRDSIFQIETNVFSFNSNVFIMTPERMSVSVHVKDMGNISIKDIKSNVEAVTQTGNILFDNIDGIVSINSINGNIIGNLSKNEVKKPLFISTLIGNIDIIIPNDCSTSILVSNEMGTIYSNILEVKNTKPIEASNQLKDRKINFNINGGGTEFVIHSYKGDIYLRQPGE